MATVILITGIFFTTFLIYGPSDDQVSRFQIPLVIGDIPASTDTGWRPHSQGATQSEIEQRFEMRRQHLKSVCSRPEYRQPDKSVLFHDYRYTSVAYRRLRWCRVAKVGTTFMKGMFFSRSHLHRSDQEDNSQEYLSKHPKTFYFVRDPYSRLVSGYLDKVIMSPDRWSDIGSLVIRTQRSDAKPSEIECGSDATFKEFFRYVIWAETTNRTRNIHFLPMHDLCDVCNRDYDFIGHLETIKEDLPFIVNSVDVKVDIGQNVTGSIVRQIQDVFDENRRLVRRCLGIYPMMKRLWWTFQVRGLIADTIPLPVSQGQIEAASWEQLASWAAKAYHDTKALGSRSVQKRAFLVNLFRSVPLDLRLKYLELYSRDFQLFQFDPLPPDIFPELNNVVNDNKQY